MYLADLKRYLKLGAGSREADGFYIIRFFLLLIIFAVLSDRSYSQTAERIFHAEPATIDSLHSFTQSISADDLSFFGDYSIQQALIRFSGVQASRMGEINIRGVGLNHFQVTLDGQPLAATGRGSRNFDLSTISVDAIQSIELIKVITPDKNADASGGIINLKSRQLAGESRDLSARAGGGVNSNYLSRTGPANRFWLNYSENVVEELSLAVNLTYQQMHQGWESLSREYGVANFGTGLVDVPESVTPAIHVNSNERLGGNLYLNYSPKAGQLFYFRAFAASSNFANVSHTNSWQANADWSDPLTTGAVGELGTYSHTAGQQNLEIFQQAYKLGGETAFDRFELRYNAGWSKSEVNNLAYSFPFMIEGLDYSIDWSDRHHPVFTITNRPTLIMEDGSVDRRFMIGQNFERIVEQHIKNEFSARVDFEFPLSVGFIKSGLSSRFTNVDGQYDENRFSYNRTLRMVGFNMLREPNRNIDVFDGHYRLPWLVNTEDARIFFEDQRPVFSGDEDFRRSRSEIRNHHALEQVHAAYAMGDFEFGNWKLLAGLRAEYNTSNYESYDVQIGENGEFLQSVPDSEQNDFIGLYPHAQLKYSYSEEGSIHLAYSRTISRPDYFVLSPFERIDHLDSTIFSGNYQLDPVTAENFDLAVSQKLSRDGFISMGAFYKELSGFVLEQQETISSGSYIGYERRFYRNGTEAASLYGAEITFDHRLTFLPGIFSHLGTYLSYTWTQSAVQMNERETAYPGQSPHAVNAALNYNLDRLYILVAYHWSAEALTQIDESPQPAPALNMNGDVYFDTYQDGYQDLSVSFRYKLSRYFQLWANVRNLLNQERIAYTNNAQFYKTSTILKDGFDLKMGIRFDL